MKLSLVEIIRELKELHLIALQSNNNELYYVTNAKLLFVLNQIDPERAAKEPHKNYEECDNSSLKECDPESESISSLKTSK